MRRAISFCAPLASIVTIAPLRLGVSRSSGIAVISYDFPRPRAAPAPARPRWRKPKPDAARPSRPRLSSNRAASCRPLRSPRVQPPRRRRPGSKASLQRLQYLYFRTASKRKFKTFHELIPLGPAEFFSDFSITKPNWPKLLLVSPWYK
jgi:hypothetical protein